MVRRECPETLTRSKIVRVLAASSCGRSRKTTHKQTPLSLQLHPEGARVSEAVGSVGALVGGRFTDIPLPSQDVGSGGFLVTRVSFVELGHKERFSEDGAAKRSEV